MTNEAHPLAEVPDDLLSILRENAPATETEGRLTPASLDALRAAGCFSLGEGAQDPRVAVSVLQQVGAACPTSAWILALTTAVTWLLPLASEEAAAAVRAADGPVVENYAPGTLTVGAGDLVLNGIWAYCSGSEVAAYAMLGALEIGESRPPRMRVAIVPTSQLRLQRTWDVASLQGTGSHTLVAEDVVVPPGYVFDLPADPDVAGRAVLRTTTFTASAIVGMAAGALDVVTRLVHSGKGPTRTRYTAYSDSPGARALFSSARARIQSAATRVEAVAASLAANPEGTEPNRLDRLARLDLRHALVTAVLDARRAVDDLCDLHGSSALARSNPLQRFWRDIGVGSRHVGLRGYILEEDLAREIVGRDDFASFIA